MFKHHDKYYIGPVVKVSGMWGWYEGCCGSSPSFVHHGNIKTYEDAVVMRIREIAIILGRGDEVIENSY